MKRVRAEVKIWVEDDESLDEFETGVLATGATVSEETALMLARVFEQSINLAARKAEHYGRAWLEQGEMGNLARIMSKVSRLRNMRWNEHPVDDSDESVLDTYRDLVNIAAFALVNKASGNRWGAP